MFARSAPQRTPPMPIAQGVRPNGMESVWRWVCPRHIALDVHAQSRREALAAIAALCSESHELASAPLLRALWRREQAGSTALGHGVAIPHARIDGIEHPLTLFLRTRTPVAFHAADGLPVADFYAILIPRESDCEAHLKLLARIAEMFSDPELRVRLTTASTAAVAHSVFADWVVRHAHDTPSGKAAGQ